MLHLRSISAALAATAFGVCLMGAYNNSASTEDSAFANSAMSAMLQSVASAEAVQGNGASGDVTKLAATLQSDELSLGTQLASLADFYGITVPTDLPKTQANATGFAQDQVTQLTKIIAIMDAERNNGSAPQLRTFADGAVTVLQKDLQAAQAAAK